MRRIVSAAAAAGLISLLVPAIAGAWPSLGQQLALDEVRPGTALASLVGKNQDFALLRPEEAQDKIGVPPWLRVLWRKQHPEGDYRPGDPTGGYPLVLREAHEWMLSHQDLKPGQPPPAVPPGRTASLGSNLRVSGWENEPRSEAAIRINPLAPTQIISASNNIRFGGGQAEYYSTDGGATWGQTSLPLIGGDAFHSDPTIDWTSDGTAWSITIGIDAFGYSLQLRAYKSTDHGATWTFDATISGAQRAADKEVIWVDHGNSSPYHDNLYVLWHNGRQVFVTRRTGGVWQTPLQVSGGETSGTGIGGDITTNADGVVFATWPDTGRQSGSQGIFMARSTDGGASFSTPLRIASTFDSFLVFVPADAYRGALIYTSTGTFKTAVHNDLYAVWNDLSGAPGCTTVFDEPGYYTNSSCKSRIWFARSTDGGSTWSAPTTINNQSSLNDQFLPALTVDAGTGRLGVTYYDTVESPDRLRTDVWYQSSFDGGATWSAPLKLTTAETDESGAPYGADANQYGDYTGLSSFAGQVFPAWTDRRNNKNEEIWTVAVSDPGCTPPGAPQAGAASPAGANQLQVSWSNGAPAASAFNVYRATGTCGAHGAWSLVAGGVAGNSHTDGAVSGTLTYAYEVAGLSGGCESVPSACMEATATGACVAPPTFAGVGAVADGAAATCALKLSWAPAAATCGGPVTYNVYRSLSPFFTPAPGNRLATGLTATSFTDSSPLAADRSYFYVVRAVDGSNGMEEGNTVSAGAAPGGPVALFDTFEGSASGGGFDTPGWTHAALSGGVDWALSTNRSQSPTHSWFSAEQPTASDRALTTPSFAVAPNATLHFWHTFAFEGNYRTCFDGGILEVSLNGGPWGPVGPGYFLAGYYNGYIASGFHNPLAGSSGWCRGTLGAMTEVIVDLSPYAGSNAKLRWHEGDDDSNALAGWYVDSVRVAASCQPANPPLSFYTIPPCRLVDTRLPNGPNGGPALQPFWTRTFQLAGSCGVPPDAVAAAVNLTVTGSSSDGNVRVWAGNQQTPLVSNINFSANQTRGNNAIVALANDGTGLVAAYANTSYYNPVHLIIDVYGYFK